MVQEWSAIRNYFYPPPDYAKAHGVKAVLYATAWCGFCKQTRAFLTQQHISYVEYDIESSPDGLEQYKRLGGNGVPVVLIAGEVIKGYRPERILKAANLSPDKKNN
jgi:mycoredoxin